MSSEKTEQPTPKRLRDSREKGQVAKSQDVPSALTVMAVAVYLLALASDMLNTMLTMGEIPMLLMDRPFEEALPLASTSILLCSLRVALPLIGMVMAVALCANLMQVGVLFSVQAAMPKLENLSMGKWFKQVFSLKNLVEFLKNIIKVLILGPSGTGKEIFAKTIHYHSPRRDAPFVAVNCTAIPESLFESEMFGIEKGVATGVSARRGLVEEASGGTLFLDELADMSLPNQAKLLRVLEEREVLRVGSARPVPVDIKVIAATNVDLRQAVARGRFRQDLYYRLNVAELMLPPLHERGDDILLLARHLLAQHARNMERAALILAPATQQCLLAYDWPGNVRELSNEMERAAALTVDTVVRPSDLSPKLLAALARHGGIRTPGAALREPPVVQETFNLEQTERLLVQRALDACQGNKSRAAELLGITREGLRKKLLRLGRTARSHDGEEA